MEPSKNALSNLKQHVDIYLENIRKETWSDYEWEAKLISQIPDFPRDHQEVVSQDHLESALNQYLKAMTKKLEQYLPSMFLEYNATLWQQKLDAAKETIQVESLSCLSFCKFV